MIPVDFLFLDLVGTNTNSILKLKYETYESLVCQILLIFKRKNVGLIHLSLQLLVQECIMRRWVKLSLITLSLFLIVSCGGGGGEISRDTTNPNPAPPAPTITIALSIENNGGEVDRNLTQDNPLTVLATVTSSDGSSQADKLITFTLNNPELAGFGNDTGTARTDAQGVARIGLVTGTVSGDGEITASLPTGEAGTTTFSATSGDIVVVQPASLQLYASSVQLASSGSDEIELIALVKNAQSVLMENIDVMFSAGSNDGVELQLTQPTTAADGTARALLTTQNDASNRMVTITAQTGSLVETVNIEITGTEVTINGTSSVIINDTVTYTLRVQDSDGVAIPNQAISLSATNGTLSDDSVTSQANGQATVSFVATAAGEAVITATSLNATSSFTLQVQEDAFSFVALPAEEVPLSQDATISVLWEQNGQPVVNGDITFSASRGSISNGTNTTTDATGQASMTLASNNAGLSSITATGRDQNGNVLVTATAEIEFIAVEPHSLIADATPDIIGPDGQTSTITAIVRDISGNLVKNTVVNFNVTDTSTGSISPSQATTDSNGVASTVFTSGAVTSEDFVEIRAEVAQDTTITDTVLMTVGNRAFDIAIGTGNLLESPDSTTYLKRFAVFVSDSVGQPIEGVTLTASSTPVKYSAGGVFRKGYWIWNEVLSIWEPNTTAVCDNEDVNSNGILDTSPFDEDTNGDGFLTPGIAGTISVSGSGVTDENGQAELVYRYPRNYGYWYDAVITVFGQSTGSEASADHYYQLGVASDDLTNEGASLPNSPFGITPVCTSID